MTISTAIGLLYVMAATILVIMKKASQTNIGSKLQYYSCDKPNLRVALPEDDVTRKARLLSQLFGIQKRDKDTLTASTYSEAIHFLDEMKDVIPAKTLLLLLTGLHTQGRAPPVSEQGDEIHTLTKSIIDEVIEAYRQRQQKPTQ